MRPNRVVFHLIYVKRKDVSAQDRIQAGRKDIMKKEQLDREHAYYRLLESELYKLLNDAGTGLFLEPDGYLFEAYDIECKEGKEGLYGYIN